MLKDPGLYGVGVDDREEPVYVQKRADIVDFAAVLLEKCQLIFEVWTGGTCKSRFRSV